MHTNSDLDNTLKNKLDELVKDKAFLELSQELNKFTPFRVLRVERYELRHTNTLAWLLDPRGSHGMRHTFLDCFLKKVLGAEAPPASPEVEVRTELVLNAGGTIVENDNSDDEELNTKDRLDILVEGRTAEDRAWVVAIEAKIDSQEGDAQLQRYDTALQRLFPGTKVTKCYLTLGPSNTVSGKDWQPIFWGKQVRSALREALASYQDLDERVRDFLEDYQELLATLSGQEAAAPGKATELANSAAFAPMLRLLNKRLKEMDVVHSWSPAPWARTYRTNKVALDACLSAVREKGAVLVWDVIGQILKTGEWEQLTTPASKTFKVRFVPRSWADVDGLKTNGQWNLFYQAEFRTTQRDIEIKLYIAPPGDSAAQKALLQRLFGEKLQLRPDDFLNPNLTKLHDFVWGSGGSVKLYKQFVDWEEQQDGTLLVSQLDVVKKQFEKAVERHTTALLGLGNAPAA